MEKGYISKLALFMESFVEFKNSLGLKYETGEYYLHKFDWYYVANKSKVNSLKDIIKSWVVLKDSECPITQHRRVALIREFGKFLQSSGYSEAYVIPKKVCQKQIRTMPHFFTNDEIISFFGACDTLETTGEYSVHHLVLPMLYRLLFCCGLRTCEARLLMWKNVNIHMGYIDIFNSKGLKDRRVFIPEDLRTLFEKYDARINDILPDRIYFFPVKIDSCYRRNAISLNFNKFWKLAGLGNESGTKARAYDYRHHFAFANINRWVEEGIDVNSMLPYLMRYMGHSSLESTFYYLHLVPEFFSTFSEKTKLLEELLPEVSYDEDE